MQPSDKGTIRKVTTAEEIRAIVDKTVGARPRPGLYWWVRDVDETGMSGSGRVAQVAVFEDGSGVVRWLKARNAVGVSSFAIYESAEDLLRVHGHGAKKTGHLEPVVPEPALGQNMFAAILDDHNFDCRGPNCNAMVLVGGKTVRCSDYKSERS